MTCLLDYLIQSAYYPPPNQYIYRVVVNGQVLARDFASEKNAKLGLRLLKQSLNNRKGWNFPDQPDLDTAIFEIIQLSVTEVGRVRV